MVPENGDPSKIRTKIFAGNNFQVATYLPVGVRDCSKDFYPDGSPFAPAINSLGDGTVPLFSAYGGTGPGALGAQVSYTNSETAQHSGLIGAYKCQLVQFMVDSTFSCNMSGLAQAPASAPVLSISVIGRPQPFLQSQGGGSAGIDTVTDLPVATITGSSVSASSDSSMLSVVNPDDGIYSLALKSAYREDYLLRITYWTINTSVNIEVIGFYNDSTTLSLVVDSGASPAISLLHNPAPPAHLRADAVISNGLFTRLSWNPSIDPLVVGYNIYGKLEDRPTLARIGSSTSTAFDTGDLWADSAQHPPRLYSVSAFYADGSESFLASAVLNNDRDHDGLSDVEEIMMGTRPDNADTDSDGLEDGDEVRRGTSPLLVDTDGDGYNDAFEVQVGTDPLNATSFGLFKDGFESGTLGRWFGIVP
jgi:hypothetical protein